MVSFSHIVIGGGPAGLNTAYHLARQGQDVKIFEEHSEIGLPFQCTGIITSELEKLIPIKNSFLVNKINSADIIINNKRIHLNLSKPNYIVNRTKLDQWLADRAEKAGADILTSSRYISNTLNNCSIKNMLDKKIRSFNFNYLIGADGPNSQVAELNNLGKNNCWIGIQARAYLPNDNIVKFFPDIGTCAWIVPENKDVVRIGLFADKNINIKQLFDKLLKASNIKKIISYQGGLIPRFNPKKRIQSGNIHLIGDAAAQVKATTGGGVVQGITASKYLAEAIINKTNYSKACRKLNKELWLHLQLRKMMDNFNGKDWSKLGNFFENRGLTAILEKKEREYPSKFLLQLILAEPKLAFLGIKSVLSLLKSKLL